MPKRPGPDSRLKRPVLPTSARVHDLYTEHLLGKTNVEGCFVGHKRSAGRRTRELSLICGVREKRPAAELGKGALLPEGVGWSRNSREDVHVRTDVQEIGESGFQARPVAGPGDLMAGVTFPQGTARAIVATLGIAIRHPRFGVVITTAGHAVQGGPGTVTYPDNQRPVVRVQNVSDDGARTDFAGEVVRSVRVEEADYALLLPTDGTPVQNLYHDVDSLAGLHLPDPSDVGKPFFALKAGGLEPTRVRGVFGVLTIEGFRLRDLILTDPVTEAGDSGCVLIDPSFRVCGMLVGFTTVEGKPHSVFMSAFWALNMEDGELF